MQSMLAEYRTFHMMHGLTGIGVTLSDSILDEAMYLQIGSEMTEAEIDMATRQEPAARILLSGDPCADWSTVAPVIPKDKFIGWGHAGIKENCFDYCAEQLKVVGRSMKSPGWGNKTKMNADIYQLYLTADVAGMKKGPQGRGFVDGIKYL